MTTDKNEKKHLMKKIPKFLSQIFDTRTGRAFQLSGFQFVSVTSKSIFDLQSVAVQTEKRVFFTGYTENCHPYTRVNNNSYSTQRNI